MGYHAPVAFQLCFGTVISSNITKII